MKKQCIAKKLLMACCTIYPGMYGISYLIPTTINRHNQLQFVLMMNKNTGKFELPQYAGNHCISMDAVRTSLKDYNVLFKDITYFASNDPNAKNCYYLIVLTDSYAQKLFIATKQIQYQDIEANVRAEIEKINQESDGLIAAFLQNNFGLAAIIPKQLGQFIPPVQPKIGSDRVHDALQTVTDALQALSQRIALLHQ